MPPKPASPYRRRRILWSLLILITIFLVYAITHPSSFFTWSLPSYLKDAGWSSSSSSRVEKVANALAAESEAAAASNRRLRVQEIHGLLHFVTAHPNRRLNEEDGGTIDVVGLGYMKVDPEESVDLRVYAPDGDDDWENHLKVLKDGHPLVVFSKTFCPYSRRAKDLLESYQIMPSPTIIELDTRPDGPIIQAILSRLTERRTVPNVLLQGDSIGGSDDIQAMHDQHKLRTLLEEGGLKVQGI